MSSPIERARAVNNARSIVSTPVVSAFRLYRDALDDGIDQGLYSVNVRATQHCADCQKLVLNGGVPKTHCADCKRTCSGCEAIQSLTQYNWDFKRKDPKIRCKKCIKDTVARNEVRTLISAWAQSFESLFTKGSLFFRLSTGIMCICLSQGKKRRAVEELQHLRETHVVSATVCILSTYI